MKTPTPTSPLSGSRIAAVMLSLLCKPPLHRRILAFLSALFLLAGQATAASTTTQSTLFSNECYVVTCPGDITLFTCGDAITPANSGVTLENKCPGTPPLILVCKPPVGTPLGLGVHAVTCSVLTPEGQPLASCSFLVTVVKDTEPPVIRCPNSIEILTCPTAAGGCGAIVTYATPIASDNSGSVAVSCIPPSGSFFPCGTTVVTCTAIDRCQNIARCEFLVTVKEGGRPPVIRCPADIVVLTCGETREVNYPDPIVSPAGSTVVCTPPSGSAFPLGVTTVICVASNPCGETKCAFTVTVLADKEAPTIVCPEKIVVTACQNAAGVCGAVVNYPAPIATDDSGSVAVNCIPPSGSFFPCGNTVVICTAIDRCQNIARCEFLVVVREGGQPPSIRCPADIVVRTCKDSAVVTYPPPTVSPASATVVCIPPSGSVFPLGVTTVICVASNACGEAKCEFTVTVRPTPPVQINCPNEPLVVTLPCNSNCVAVIYPLPTVSNGSIETCNPPSGTCLTAGIHVVTCTATNGCDRAECKFLVRVVPGQGEPPILRCPQDIVVNGCDDCQIVNYPDPVVVNGTLVGCLPPSGKCFPIGTTTVICLATNGCGESRCSFTVTVRPTPRLEIKCPENIVVSTCGEGEIVNYPKPTVLGSVDPSTYTVECIPPSGSVFPLGVHRVVCCVTDRCQRKVCCEFTITVVKGEGCVKPPLNMVLWLPFDEPVGPNAENTIAGAPNGVHVNGPTPIIGQKVLNGLGFDGVNDYVVVPNYAAIVLNQTDLSIDAWILRREEAGRRVIVSKLSGGVPGAAPSVRGYEFYLNNGIMHLGLAGALAQNFNSAALVPLDGSWHHVAVTVKRAGGGQVIFYLDGLPVSAMAGPITAPLGTTSRLHVGASTYPLPKDFFRGGIDELEIFDRVLTPGEVHSLWKADKAGKCKIKCYVPWDVSFPPNGGYVTVKAYIWNFSPVTQTITWVASGPMPIPTPTGTFILPPISCTNVFIKLCAPTNGAPVGSVVEWMLDVYYGSGCPLQCMGSVINPGTAVVSIPDDLLDVPGTSRPRIEPVTVAGLPPNAPFRIRAIGPDMEPDTDTISLNGLPPGTPWLRKVGGPAPAADGEVFDLSIRFVKSDPIGLYTILLEADVNGDGEFDTLRSFDVENPVIPPPVLVIVDGPNGHSLTWNDEGDGILETAQSVDGPWKSIPDARPGYPFSLSDTQRYFRVVVAIPEEPIPAVQ